MKLFRLAISFFALCMIFFGVITAISPIPIGLPLVIIGFALLATASPNSLKWWRRRWGWLDRRLVWMQEHLPRRTARALRRSDPNVPEEEKEEEVEGAETEATTRA